MIRNLNNCDLKDATQSFLRGCWFCSFLKSYFISTAGSTSGSDHRERLFISFAVRKYPFTTVLCFLLLGISPGFVSPPKSAEFYRRSSTWSPNLPQLCWLLLLSSHWDMRWCNLPVRLVYWRRGRCAARWRRSAVNGTCRPFVSVSALFMCLQAVKGFLNASVTRMMRYLHIRHPLVAPSYFHAARRTQPHSANPVPLVVLNPSYRSSHDPSCHSEQVACGVNWSN